MTRDPYETLFRERSQAKKKKSPLEGMLIKTSLGRLEGPVYEAPSPRFRREANV